LAATLEKSPRWCCVPACDLAMLSMSFDTFSDDCG